MRLHILLALPLCLTLAEPVLAEVDCSKLNDPVSLSTVDAEAVYDCIQKTPTLLSQRDGKGRTFLMNMVASEIDPLMVEASLWLLEPDQVSEILEATTPAGENAVHIAAAYGTDPAMITVLSSWGVDINATFNMGDGWLAGGTTPLHLAAPRPDGEMFVATLLALNAIETTDRHEKYPVDLARGSNDTPLESTILLLEKGEWANFFKFKLADYPKPEKVECSLLEESYWQKDLILIEAAVDETSEYLVNHLAHCLTSTNQFDAVDGQGNTILHLAARYAVDPEIIDVILSKASDKEALLAKINSKDQTALHLAAAYSNSPWLVTRLLAWGANPNALTGQVKKIGRSAKGVSPLHLAASRKDDFRETMMALLLAYGADTMVRDIPDGRTALHRVALAPDPYALLLLMEAQAMQENLLAALARGILGKAIKQIEDNEGRTALHIASGRDGDFFTIDYLLQYGFSVDEPDTSGTTPLMYAAQKLSDIDTFMSMLERSKKPCKASKQGAKVESLLALNPILSKVDPSGQTLTPLAELKKRCQK